MMTLTAARAMQFPRHRLLLSSHPSSFFSMTLENMSKASQQMYLGLFPGQGAQYSGMGRVYYERHPELREYFHKADRILGIPLTETMFYGSEETLRATELCQPAILLNSFVAFKAYQKRKIGSLHSVVGHSLGEYTALLCSGIIGFEDALLIVRQRGLVMAKATKSLKEALGMFVIVLSPTQNHKNLETWIMDYKCKTPSIHKTVIEIANYNSEKQIALSGHINAIREMITVMKASKLIEMSGKKLNVSGPFHSSLMEEASLDFGKFIDHYTLSMNSPVLEFISSCTGSKTFFDNSKTLKDYLKCQLVRPVLWYQAIQPYLKSNSSWHFVEFGSNILSNLIKREGHGQNITVIE